MVISPFLTLEISLFYLFSSGYDVFLPLCVGGWLSVGYTAFATLAIAIWVELHKYDRVLQVQYVRPSLSAVDSDIP